jgi:hypothetical protein
VQLTVFREIVDKPWSWTLANHDYTIFGACLPAEGMIE